ncbi:hypothetical protein C2G38_798604 [Gigaspora rosea]|uniref:Uncharacterized protein n=1 Tax=Gigaspora rosea TaxID=44941 RepID=A0A397U2A6_9GLOM|nr:hypothetical protein C2G38_798604 [Gigaspora rosea]
MLFSVEEWNEIRHTVKATSKLRQVLRTTSFLNEDEPYNCEKHYDAGLTDYEDPNEPLQKQHLESWFNINLSTSYAIVRTCDESLLSRDGYRRLAAVEPQLIREHQIAARRIEITDLMNDKIKIETFSTNDLDDDTLFEQSEMAFIDQSNVWSLVIDHGLQNVIGMETVRKESTSETVSNRKNRKRVRTRHKNVGCKKMGYRMDGIFRIYVNNMEYGAVEVAKKFKETKLLADGEKLWTTYLYP